MRLALLLAGLAVFLPLAFTSVYSPVQKWIGSAWGGALIVNAALAVAVLLSGRRLQSQAQSVTVAKRPWLVWFPALMILTGSVLLVLIVASVSEEPLRFAGIPVEQMWFVFVVPIVEEIVFRLGIGTVFRRLGGVFFGSWFSAFLFAFVHSQPTLQDVAILQVGLPLGPFLLGLICEALLVSSGRIWPAILFHAACNATVVVFAIGHPAIFESLRFLYS
jgi:membrane protease YdiL (CAAX protease family)